MSPRGPSRDVSPGATQSEPDYTAVGPRSRVVKALWVANGVLTTGFLAFLWLTSARPLIDDHSFRQTQTALSVYHILNGGPWIDYLTPILGAPWAIPFEAPIYHWVVAIVASALPLDVSGRVVSAGFLLGAIAFGHGIVRLLVPPNSAGPPLFVTLALASPLHLFFGRAFLIESCALFFGMAHLYYGMRFVDVGAWRPFVACGAAGILCALAKSTTWPAFALVIGLYGLVQFWRGRAVDPRRAGGIALVWGAALLSGLAWTAHADALKVQNTLGATVTSAALHGWNWGSIEQRLGAQLWAQRLPRRMLPDVLGWLWPLATVPLAYAFTLAAPRIRMACGILMVAFLFPLIAFPNLHLIHSYYQMANGALLLMAIAVALGTLFDRSLTVPAAVTAVLLVAGQLAFFTQHHWVRAFAANHNEEVLMAARHAGDTTGEDTALVAIGIDWSSIAHYYARRKGLAIPPWAGDERLDRVLGDLPGHLGGLPLASIIDCRPLGFWRYPPRQVVRLDQLVQDFRRRPGVVERDFGRCRALTVPATRAPTALGRSG